MDQSYSGIVRAGEGTATALGFPTVNISLADQNVSGIFAATVKVGNHEYPAAVFADPNRKLLEAHILDFEKDLYGQEVIIILHEKLRESEKFENAERLAEAIAKDVRYTRAYFARKAGK